MKANYRTTRRPLGRSIRTTGYQALELRRMLAGPELVVPYLPVLDYQFEQDSLGRVVNETTTMDMDGDGVADMRSMSHYAYAEGNGLTTTTAVHEQDWDADGTINTSSTVETVIDADGRVLTQLSSGDWQGDGQVDYRTLQTSSYGEDGQLVSVRTDVDQDGDGTFDDWYEELIGAGGGDPGLGLGVDTAEEYDGQGRLIRTTTRQDLDQDGTWDRTDTVSYEYGADSRLETSTEERDHEGDGVVDYRAVATHEYDENGNLVAIHHAVDEDGDGVVDLERTDIIEAVIEEVVLTESDEELDGEGRLVQLTTRYDFDWDGTWDQIETSWYTWRADSQIGTETWESDRDGNGTVDYRSVATYEYDAEGHSGVILMAVDEDGDGTVDLEYTIDNSWANPIFIAAGGLPLEAGNATDDGVRGVVGHTDEPAMNPLAVSFAVRDSAFFVEDATGSARQLPTAMTTLLPEVADDLALSGALALSGTGRLGEWSSESDVRKWKAETGRESADPDSAGSAFHVDNDEPSGKSRL